MMKKRILSVFLSFAMILTLLSACQSPASQDKTQKDQKQAEVKKDQDTQTPSFKGQTLNVVATSDKYVKLFNKFTEKTGAKVEFLSMSSGEVLSRAKAEGKPMADLWFGGGLDAFMKAKTDGLLENYTPKNADKVPAEFKDKDGAWIAKGITVVGFLVNNDLLKEKNLPVPKTWKDLADPKYKNEIIMSNPSISGTNYAVLKGLLDTMGENEGWAYFKALNDNISFYGKRGKDPQEKTAAGEFAIGIIPADKSAFDTAQKQNLSVIYPEDGIPWVPEGVAIFKNSAHANIAKAFEDFMLTDEAQQMIAELDGKDSAQLIMPNIKGFDLGLPKDKLLKQDLSTYGSQRDMILKKFTDLAKDKI